MECGDCALCVCFALTVQHGTVQTKKLFLHFCIFVAENTVQHLECSPTFTSLTHTQPSLCDHSENSLSFSSDPATAYQTAPWPSTSATHLATMADTSTTNTSQTAAPPRCSATGPTKQHLRQSRAVHFAQRHPHSTATTPHAHQRRQRTAMLRLKVTNFARTQHQRTTPKVQI